MSTTQKQEEARFRNHVRRLSVRNFPGNNDGFDDELTELGKVDQRVRSNLDEFYTGSLGSSMAKNRFDDVKPNEQTIVKLRPMSKRGDGTYINANYIDARKTMGVPFVYIATQAPMQNTVLDFWRMVYENDVAFIVMLCAVKENGKVKSETYWPALGQVYDLGLLSVATLSENVRSDSVHRTLLLRTVRGDEKEVYHMQYLAWPDQGIPTTSVPLMEMIQAIGKSRRSVESPIVVHCSGGIGRTGVFIGMHIALAQFQLEQTSISIMRIVRFLKLCRSGMVQRKDQYIYLYYSVQREMERMILSAERGVNLLDIRPRDKPIPAQRIPASDTRPRLVGQPTINGFLPARSRNNPPDANRTLWSSEALGGILRAARPESAHERPRGIVSRLPETGRSPARGRGASPARHGHASHSPPHTQDGRRNRDVVTDMAAMEEYLRRNPSMRAHVQLPAEEQHALEWGGHSDADSREAPTRPLAIGREFFGRGGKSYHSHGRRATPPRRTTTPPPRTPTPCQLADTAAQTKLEAELLRIQSLNRRMRFAGDDASAPAPAEVTRTPLSITRETPRTRESTPRVVMSARERSMREQDDDLAYLRRRVATTDDWRRL